MNIESQPFCPECLAPKNSAGGFDHYENCSLAKEAEKTEKKNKKEERFPKEKRESIDLPESDFAEHFEKRKEEELNTTIDKLLDEAFPKKKEEKKETKREIPKHLANIIEFIWKEKILPHLEDIEKNENSQKYMNTLAEEFTKKLTDEGKKIVMDEIERMAIKKGGRIMEIFIMMKSKHYGPMEKSALEKIKRIEEQKKRR